MHIPPYHKKPAWQLLIVGCTLGAIVSYFVLIYMYGSMYEELIEENLELQSQYNELKRQNEALLAANEDLNEKSNQEPIIELIEVQIINPEEVKLDRLIMHELEDLIKDEINYLIGRRVDSISESDLLLYRTIENKGFTIEDITYYFDITELTISKSLKIKLRAKLSNKI
ncbi:hypothetical protein D8M04_00935 [Oceanobacillus piezotolerans]|uniref:Sporulation membrane protein YtrI C-terminal domain-containing protein n=1 Tax=Oceanobacillus piezotolerans TaxID=2448030 RepID=A0A498DCV5_9BACI|nr:sporulation membrane protein YtrI [Oceanobacillus piezotolerans]RLL47876.1 hypothetical protein D8M04_00935 [Oceanobacillus piezotolerans]